MSNLEGKVALVTGGGSGIGRGISERLAREGADVCIADIDLEGAEQTAALVREAGRKALVAQANTASAEQLEKAVSACVSALGRLDIAVANAGIARGGSVLEMTLKDWQDQVDVNLTGVFLTVQSCARRMVEVGTGGRIVCISSLAAEIVGPSSWSYSATKAGVRIMVRGWAQELGEHDITVNAIGPGVIDTPLAAAIAGEEGGAIRAGLEKITPVKRAGKPADIAGLVAFMAGPDGEFMSGSYVIMDGGLRDANRRRTPSADDPRMQEWQKLMAQGAKRRAKLQPLIDER